MSGAEKKQQKQQKQRGAAVVIGGLGFVGKRLVTLLKARGDLYSHVRVADVRMPDEFDKAEPESKTVSYHVVDVRHRDTLPAVLKGADTVFLVAAIVDVSVHENPLMRDVNVAGADNVIAVCLEEGVKRLIYTATEDVVFDGSPKFLSSEDEGYPSATAGNLYCTTKRAAERAVLNANGTFRKGGGGGKGGTQLMTGSVRPCAVFGPGDEHHIPPVVDLLRKQGMPMWLGPRNAAFGAGNSFTYVDNVAALHVVLAEKMDSPEAACCGEAFFAVDGNTYSYRDFYTPYMNALGLDLPRWDVPYPLARAFVSVSDLVARISGLFCGKKMRLDPKLTSFSLCFITQHNTYSGRKAERMLGFVPPVSVVEAHKRTLEWVLEEFKDGKSFGEDRRAAREAKKKRS